MNEIRTEEDAGEIWEKVSRVRPSDNVSNKKGLTNAVPLSADLGSSSFDSLVRNWSRSRSRGGRGQRKEKGNRDLCELHDEYGLKRRG